VAFFVGGFYLRFCTIGRMNSQLQQEGFIFVDKFFQRKNKMHSSAVTMAVNHKSFTVT